MASRATRAAAQAQATRGQDTAGPVTVTTPAPQFAWDELLAPVQAPASTYTVGAKFTVDQIPEVIRQRVELSLGTAVAAIKAATTAGKDPKTVPPQWMLQPVPSEAVGADFVKLARKYGQHRPETDIPFYVPGTPTGQITVRLGVIHYVSASGQVPEGTKPAPEGIAPGWYVRYAAKPLEGKGK